jgi:membrane protein
LTGLVGRDSAKAVEALLAASSQPGRGVIASIVGFVTLVIGATSVFGELQSSLDRIWRAPVMPQAAGILATLRSRIFPFGMVLAIGFLLLVSLVIGAALTALGKFSGTLLPGALLALQLINLVVGFAITTALFAMTYRVLPRVSIQWSDVWMGAIVTAVLFTVGKYLIGLYIGYAGTSSAFGAAGSLIVVLVWVYYSAQIFLLGAEFTWLFAHRHGSRRNEASAA